MDSVKLVEVDYPQIGFQDFPLICRICLSSDNLNNFEERKSLITLFINITEIQVDPNDILPKNVCLRCFDQLDDIVHFLDLAKKSDAALRQVIIKHEIKVETYCEDFSTVDDHYEISENSDNALSPKIDLEEQKIVDCVIDENNDSNEELSGAEDSVQSKPNKTYTCSVCFKTFVNKPNLCKHKILHTGIKPFECHICKKTFAKKDNLKIHMKVHTGSKPFQCTICEKSFTQSGNLNVHVRSHLNLKPFSCTICLKSFSKKWILTDHLRRHSGERQFKCNLCLKDFAMKQSYRNHMRAHRLDENQFYDPFGVGLDATDNPLAVDEFKDDISDIKIEN